MNNFRFRRFLSGVLALVMMTSALTMMNVVSVSAKDDGWLVTETEKQPDWITINGPALAVLDSGTSKNATFNDNIFGTTNKIGENKGYKFNSNSHNFTVTVTGKADLTVYAGRDNNKTGSFTITTEGNGTASASTLSVPALKATDNQNLSPSHVTLTSEGEATKYIFTSGSAFLYKVILTTPDGGDDSQYTWTVDPQNVSQLSGASDLLKVASENTLTKRNTLVYTGTDYTLMPKYSHLYEGLNVEGTEILKVEGYSITVTPTMDMFMKNVNIPKNNISIENGNNRILHLTCKDHGATYSILLDDGGKDDIAHAKSLLESDGNGYYTLVDSIDLPVHNDVYTASIGGGTLTLNGGNEITINGSEVTISGRFEPYEELPITNSTDEINVFANLKTTAGARAERILTGTVLGTEGNEFFHVVGPDRNFGNVYALSGTENEEEYGTDAFAVVIRSSSEYEDLKGGGIGFEISNNIPDGSKFTLEVKCTGVEDPQTGGKTTTIGLAKLTEDSGTHVEKLGEPVGEAKPITQVQDSDKNPPEEAIKFENLEPGKYAIYNPGTAETTGNIRVYSMKLTRVEGGTTSTEFVDVLDSAQLDNSLSLDNGATETVGGGKDGLGSAGTKFTISGQLNINSSDVSGKTLNLPGNKTITTSQAIYFANNGSTSQRYIKFVTEGTESNTGKIYIYASSNGSTARDYTLEEDGGQKQTLDTKAGKISDPPSAITAEITGGKTYYLYASGKCYVYYVGSTIPLKALGEPEVKAPVITGTVTLKDEYKYIEPTGVRDKEKESVTPNVVNPGSKTALDKTDNKTIEKLEVKAQAADGTEVNADQIKITDNKTFTIGGEAGLTPNTKYTVTVTADGVTSKQEVELKETAATADFDLTTPSVTVRFVTNIKNYKDSNDGGQQTIPRIQKSDGTDLFDLADETYYTKGADLSSLEAVNGSASTTHIVSMPKGKYQYKYDSKYYTLSQDSSGASTSMEFEVTASGRKYIYFTPQIDQLQKDVTDTVSTAMSTVEATSVLRGKYTFGVPTGSETSNEVAITYEGSASEGTDGQNHGMRAYGIKGTADEVTYFGINQNHGAVVFRLDKPMLAHITTEQKSCALYNVEYSPLSRAANNSINGTFGLIPIDSSFSRRFISLDAGTYALVSLTTDAAKPAKVTSIEFVEDAPFVIKKNEDTGKSDDIIDYNEDGVTGKMIIGTYDSKNDDLIGTTSAASYSTFSILVANNKDALTAANIDNIVGGNGYEKEGIVDVSKSAESEDYNSTAYKMTVGSDDSQYTVLRDDTTMIFSRIVGADGTDLKTSSDENGEKYYATIIKNLTKGTYYAVGAAKVNGATEAQNKGAWLVQESPVEFTVD